MSRVHMSCKKEEEKVTHRLGLVIATLRRRGSATKPMLPSSLLRTALKMTTSASRPW